MTTQTKLIHQTYDGVSLVLKTETTTQHPTALPFVFGLRRRAIDQKKRHIIDDVDPAVTMNGTD